MGLSQYLGSVRNHLKRRRRAAKARDVAARPGSCRPLLELLEDRLAPATVTWNNPAGGDWDTTSNWSTAALPGSGDDVVINSLNAGASITHAQNNTDAVNSITATAPITLSGGTLTVAGAFSDSSAVTIAGGTLANASVAAATTITGTTSGGILSAVSLAGTLDLTGPGRATMAVSGGLTLVSGSVIEIGSSGNNFDSLSFDGSQTLGGAGSVVFGGFYGALLAGPTAGAALTIGPSITVHGQNGDIGYSGNFSGFSSNVTVTNQGTIDADTAGETLTVAGLTNFAGGTLTGGTWEASGGGGLDLIGATITTNAATIVLDGAASEIYSDAGNTNALGGFATNSAGAGADLRQFERELCHVQFAAEQRHSGVHDPDQCDRIRSVDAPEDHHLDQPRRRRLGHSRKLEQRDGTGVRQ